MIENLNIRKMYTPKYKIGDCFLRNKELLIVESIVQGLDRQFYRLKRLNKPSIQKSCKTFDTNEMKKKQKFLGSNTDAIKTLYG